MFPAIDFHISRLQGGAPEAIRHLIRNASAQDPYAQEMEVPSDMYHSPAGGPGGPGGAQVVEAMRFGDRGDERVVF